jgi:hypothetical protein
MAGVPFFVLPSPFTVTASTNFLASNPAGNLAEFQFSGMTGKASAAGSTTFNGDFGSSVPIDFVGVLGANATAATTIRVLLADTLADLSGGATLVDSGAVSFISPAVATSSGLYSSFYSLTQVTRRYFQIIISHPFANFEAAFAVFGAKVQPSMYYEPEWEAGPIDLSTIAIGRNGVPDIAPGLIHRGIGFTLAWQTEAEFQTQMQPLANAAGKTNPVYLCFDPAATAYRQDRTYFGRFTDGLRTTKKGWNRFTRSFAMQSMI